MIHPIDNKRIKTSIFYINDFHGKTINMEKTASASKDFDIEHNKQDTDVLKLSSGDIMIGEDINTNKIAATFQNITGISASATGNHEYDIQNNFSEISPIIKYNLLANNISINNSKSPFYNKIKSSIIEEHNGHKYGIIGTTPIDLFKRTKNGDIKKDISVDDLKTTVEKIQKDVSILESKGVNKIILLSHLGNDIEKYIAKHTNGIDVILGGHTHNLILDVKEGENLFYNKRGEPVVITQAGRDGQHFGILNLEFDENGIIKKVQNNVGETKKFHRNMPVKYIFDKLFGTNKIFGKIKSAAPAVKNDLLDANAHANFIADCIKQDLNPDIVLLPSANIRGFFEEGDVDTRILADILPFKNKLWEIKYSEKEIVDALKAGAQSFNNSGNKPGIFYVSGLKYTVDKNGNLKSLIFEDKNGNKKPIDINNPKEDKFYTTILNDYCAEGNDGFKMLNHPERIIKKYDFDAVKCIENTLQRNNKPVEIKDDGRIKII